MPPRARLAPFLQGAAVALLAGLPAPAFATGDGLPSWIAYVLTTLVASTVVAILLVGALDNDDASRLSVDERNPEYDLPP